MSKHQGNPHDIGMWFWVVVFVVALVINAVIELFGGCGCPR